MPADIVGMGRNALSSPRFSSALSTLAIGVAVFASVLHRVIGWAGLIAMLVTLVLLAVLSVLERRREIQWAGLLPLSLLLFVGWAGLSVLWSEYRSATADGFAYLLAFTILGIAIALSRDTIQLVRAFGDVFRVALVVSLTIEVIAGLLIDSPIRFLSVAGDLDVLGPIQGIMGSRNQLGLLALLAIVTFGIELRTRSVSRQLAIGSLVLGGLALALSRSPVTGAVFVVVVLATGSLYLLRRLTPVRRRFWQLALVAAALVAAVVAWAARSQIITLFSANSELSYRLSLWQQLWALIPQNPLQGWGWIGYWRSDRQPFFAFSVIGDRESTSAVNAYLDVWFQLGLVGIFLFGVLVVLAFVRSWLLAGRQRSVVFTWPALVLLTLIVTSLAESSMLVEYGWMLLVVCTVKAAQELSWRSAFGTTEADPTE